MQLVRSWAWRLATAWTAGGRHPLVGRARAVLPGSALGLVLALAAAQVAGTQGGPPFLYALLFGIAFHHLSADPVFQAGIEFCARTVLRVGVSLLGVRITVAQIAELGGHTVAVVALAVFSTMAVGRWVGTRLGLNRSQAWLTGGAVAICGASAALALAAVLPRRQLQEQFTLMVVVAVTVLSTVAMVAYPLLARVLHLPPEQAGLFLGGSIHDVAQVVGAGYSLGQPTGDAATLVKLLRVAMLAVVVVALSFLFRTERQQDTLAPGLAPHRTPLVPWFLWLFVALVAIRSIGAVPNGLQERLEDVSRHCLIVAIAALGVKTSFRQLARVGWRPLTVVVLETLWLASWMLVAAWVTRA